MVLVRLVVGVSLAVVLAAAPAAGQSGGGADAVADALVALRTEAMLLVELDGLETVPGPLVEVHADWVGFTNGSTRDELLRWLYEVDDAGAAALDRMHAVGIRPAPPVVLTLAELGSPDRLALESFDTVDVSPEDYTAALDSLAARLGPGFSIPEAPIGGTATPDADTAVPSGTDQSRRNVARTATTAPYPWVAVTSALLAVLMAGMLMVLVGRRSRRPADDGVPPAIRPYEVDRSDKPVAIP